ncbi:hypothetical protein GLAREA_09188 [Glarea lozoyensis ATCC 20868]|uniref:Uncharacterized protein n=1 Tax=Glarea lozoyensis (strain ATCC 20868 / MF5171) TaxID=1116229 RepID=S3DH36_GLAL2|nr:uncharacterized protein GLAREA_09188 [Glarea lozoyensis ATCC 20868]EPE37025.1 hypothetical protein GLAREA_09188 [Glarea lozoyensis ATCC 20868]
MTSQNRSAPTLVSLNAREAPPIMLSLIRSGGKRKNDRIVPRTTSTESPVQIRVLRWSCDQMASVHGNNFPLKSIISNQPWLVERIE